MRSRNLGVAIVGSHSNLVNRFCRVESRATKHQMSARQVCLSSLAHGHRPFLTCYPRFMQMVVAFGMSDIGPWNLQDPNAQGGDMIMRMMARNNMSEKLAEDIDRAVKDLSDKAYEVSKQQIKENR